MHWSFVAYAAAAGLVAWLAVKVATWTLRGLLADIRNELQPNDGKSLADAVKRVEIKLDEHIRYHESW